MDLGTIGFTVEVTGSDQAISNVNRYVDAIKKASAASKAHVDLENRLQKSYEQTRSKDFRDATNKTRAMISLGKQREAAKKQEIDKEIAENKRIRAEYLRVAESVDPVIRANNEYARSIEAVSAARRRGAITAEEELEMMRKIEHHRTISSNSLNTYMRDSRGAVQQLGYQVADFAVQVQSGTNVLVAMAQQGSQVLGMFGAGGAVAGALLAVGSAVATTFIEGYTEAKTLREEIDDLVNSVDDFNDAASRYTVDGLEEYRKKYGEIDAQVRQLIDSETEHARMASKRELKGALAGISDVAGPSWYHMGVSNEISSLMNLQSMFNVTIEDAKSLKYAFDEVSSAKSYEQQSEALTRLSEYLKIVLSSQENVTEEQLATFDAVNKALGAVKELANTEPKANWLSYMVNEAETFKTTIDSARSAITFLSSAAPKSNWLDSAISGVTSLISKFSEAAVAKSKALGTSVMPSSSGAVTGGSGDSMVPGGAGNDRLTGMGSGSGSTSSSALPSAVSFGSVSVGGSDPLAELYKQIEAEKQLLGVSEAQRRVQQALGDERAKYSEVEIANVVAEIEALERKNETMRQQQNIADTIKSSMESSFMSMMDGTKSVGDSFKDMARSIVTELYNVLVVQQLVGSWNAQTKTGSGILGMIFSAFQENGGAWNKGSQVEAFANGGVVTRPTSFGMSGGRTGLMGEAGPEAIMPLKRGRDGKLGVSVNSENTGSITINNNINVTGSDATAVRGEIMKMLPQITEVTKASVLSARQRGGSFRDAFN